MRVPLAVGGPEHEERNHDDAAADAEQAGEEPAGDPDRDEARLEPEQRTPDPGSVPARLLARVLPRAQWTRDY